MTDEDRRRRAQWLGSPAAAPVLALARELAAGGDPLAAGQRLRQAHPDLAADLASAALEQADLARRARDRYGIDAAGLLFTRDGLEAATRPEVAARRGRLLAAAGARQVLDLTGGLGFDCRGFAAAGLAVTVVERDPAVAVLLAANCPTATVFTADGLAALPDLLGSLAPADVVFVDPARRDPSGPRDAGTARARPERDPERWSPPWSAVAGIPHPRVAAKVAPGFAVPPGWQAEWVSVDRTVVECAVYSWPLLAASRQAVVMADGVTTVVPAADAAADHELPIAAAVGAWLHEPDPAVLRAGALPGLAEREGLLGLGPGSTWLTGDHAATSPALRSFLVVAELVGSHRDQRRQLAELGVDRLTVKSRDVAADPQAVLRSLRLREGAGHVLVLTRRDGRQVSLLAQPARARER